MTRTESVGLAALTLAIVAITSCTPRQYTMLDLQSIRKRPGCVPGPPKDCCRQVGYMVEIADAGGTKRTFYELAGLRSNEGGRPFVNARSDKNFVTAVTNDKRVRVSQQITSEGLVLSFKNESAQPIDAVMLGLCDCGEPCGLCGPDCNETKIAGKAVWRLGKPTSRTVKPGEIVQLETIKVIDR
jgi:hypothetical protein